MIVKKVRREIVDKPKTWQIGDLVDYIRFPHNKNPQEKVAHAGVLRAGDGDLDLGIGLHVLVNVLLVVGAEPELALQLAGKHKGACSQSPH